MTVATEAKDRVSSKGSKERSRQRFTLAEDGKEYGEEIVGSKIQVWWPIDKEFYDGIVESFDPVKRKHQILYADNDREVLNLRKQKWNLVTSSEGSEKKGEACHVNHVDSSNTQQNKTLKVESDSIGKMGNTGTPPKRRGRPPKNVIALGNAGKDTKSEGETSAGKSKVDSMADGGNPVKSAESPSNSLPNLNDLFEDVEEEKEVSENDGTQTGKCSTYVGVVANVAPKEATSGIDINETLALGSDENHILDETKTPKSGNSDVNVTEEVKPGPSGGSKTELNKNNSASDPAKKPRKRKARTSSNSSSPAVLGSPDTSVKRRRGRPSRLPVETSDEKSEVVKKQLGDPKMDESRSGGHSDNLVTVNSEDSLVEGQNKPDVNAEVKVSEHGVPYKNVTKATDSVMKGTKADVAREQISSKSTSGEPESNSSPKLKFKLQISDAEPKLGRKRARKTTTSSEKLKADGPVKRPRGRPCKPKIGDPKSNISHGNGSGSSLLFKNDIVDAVMKDKLDSCTHSEAVDLNLVSAAESKGDDASEKSHESEVSKEIMKTSASSKEQESEANAAHDSEERSRETKSKESK